MAGPVFSRFPGAQPLHEIQNPLLAAPRNALWSFGIVKVDMAVSVNWQGVLFVGPQLLGESWGLLVFPERVRKDD